MTKTAKLPTLPSMLAVTGTIDPSVMVFYSANADELPTTPAASPTKAYGLIPVQKHGILATSSNFLNASKREKAVSDKKNSPALGNPQQVHKTMLVVDHDTLVARGSFKFQNRDQDIASNSKEYKDAIIEFKKAYFATTKGTELAGLYLRNIANGRLLWRNSNFKIDVFVRDRYGDNPAWLQLTKADVVQEDVFSAVQEKIATALFDPAASMLLEYEIRSLVGFGARIYPSQLFSEKDSDVGVELFTHPLHDGRHTTGMSPQKAGNALRTIDQWATPDKTIAISAYGSDTRNATAFRLKTSFYEYLTDLLTQTSNLATQVTPEHHYVAAMLVLGGVFSGDKA